MSSDFEDFGGKNFFINLVTDFYKGVKEDPILRPMYPEDDFDGAIERLSLFLMQYWGGPSTYSEQRGHPRLRMRHMPFAIDFKARDAWLTHMQSALKNQKLNSELETKIWNYLSMAANSMVNTRNDEII
ncbi:MAG: globin [Candidatus Nanopelagicales bacterium]|jgi:hemoglobin|nr:globin [Actinomycetota bacterium]